MSRSNVGVLRAIAASLIFVGSCQFAYAQQTVAHRSNAVLHVTGTPPGREALDESVMQIATQAAFRSPTDPQTHDQKVLGILLLLSAPPMNSRKTP